MTASVTIEREDEYAPPVLNLAPEESWRPALVKLTKDVEALANDLLRGFGSRRSILEWEQTLCVATFGMVEDAFYRHVASGFRAYLTERDAEATVMAVLLDGFARNRDITDEKAVFARERMISRHIFPAYQRAFRELRADAGEYVDAEDFDPADSSTQQRYRAMRPVLDELDAWQRSALDDVLAGFASSAAILEWGETMQLATHGDINETFIQNCHDEASIASVLQADSWAAARARELFAAWYLVPAFNRGAATLSGRAKELPAEEKEAREATPV